MCNMLPALVPDAGRHLNMYRWPGCKLVTRVSIAAPLYTSRQLSSLSPASAGAASSLLPQPPAQLEPHASSGPVEWL